MKSKSKFNEIAKKAGESINKAASKSAEVVSDVAKATPDATSKVVANIKNTANKTKDSVVDAVDQNGNGEIDIEDVIILALKTPGIKIDRESFLRKELTNKCTYEQIDKAINSTPMEAGISARIIDKVADDVIQFERNCVSGISAALGAPGGVAMVATIPADISQYYGYMLRATQKLMYLYGFPEIEMSDNANQIDTGTMNTLILCLGVMYGVHGANAAIRSMAIALSKGVEKKMLQAALTKTFFYPIVKKVALWFNVRMTKQIFAGFFKKAIPVVGGVVGGGITYMTFKPCCDKLQASLQDTMLSNPNFKKSDDDIDIIDLCID